MKTKNVLALQVVKHMLKAMNAGGQITVRTNSYRVKGIYFKDEKEDDHRYSDAYMKKLILS